MALTKAKIVKIKADGTESESKDCLFNPETLSYSRSASWTTRTVPQNSLPRYIFSGGGSGSLSVTLIFDTSDTGEDVRTKYTKFLFSFFQVESGTDKDGNAVEQPPYCRFEWGDKDWAGGYTFVKGVVTNVKVDYTLFLESGKPIRAKASLTINEVGEATQAQNPTSRSEARKMWIVREGERLDWIAYREYGDSAQWRHIARTNDLANPWDLYPGQVLKLTPLP